MPKLKTYSDNSTENIKLRDQLHTGLIQARFVYHMTMSGDSLFSSGSWGTVATLKLAKSEQGTDPVTVEVKQFGNRFNNGGNYSQLVLLDTKDESDMHTVLMDEYATTSLTDPIVGTQYEDGVFRFLAKNQERLRANPKPSKMDQDLRNLRHKLIKGLAKKLQKRHSSWGKQRAEDSATRRIDDIFKKFIGKPSYAPKYQAYYRNNLRAGHHAAKSADRLSEHFGELADDLLNSKAKTRFTAARGEYAAAKVMSTLFGDSPVYELKKGTAKQGGQNGIDQIWVKRGKKGDVLAYVLVEAKGSAGAHMGITTEGVQMSPRWVVYVLMRMAQGDKRYVDSTRPNQPRTATKILDAIFDDTRAIPVVGLKVHSLYDSHDLMNEVVEVSDLGLYNNPDVLTQVRGTHTPVLQLGLGSFF